MLARKEVLTGKAKFGIIGDGKELPQVALAEQFKPGDWRSGYYRDQTLMLALGIATAQNLFAQLYADPKGDPFSGGRQMNSHFATPTVDARGQLLPLAQTLNSSSDISSTAGQMARGLGLALASKKFRQLPAFAESPLSRQGHEICWVTIGDASTSEGVFWESVNAAGVLQVPMVVSVWDDGYGISVPIEYQTTKASISAALAGLQRTEQEAGIEILKARAWDYTELAKAYATAAELARRDHVPVLVHVTEVTQQLGHSTSGSHERYKPKERLKFEKEYDCNVRFAKWLETEKGVAPAALEATKERAEKDAKAAQREAWRSMQQQVEVVKEKALELLPATSTAAEELANLRQPMFADVYVPVRRYLHQLRREGKQPSAELSAFAKTFQDRADEDYHSKLYLAGDQSVLNVAAEPAVYADDAEEKPGFQLLNRFFDYLFEHNDKVLAFGEDVGHIGDVNQGFADLQKKYGEERIFDTGIREWTIVGQAIGLALRGFRPIAEIQYLDYLIYAMSPLSDDLATTLYRTDGIQQAPAIIRTRGHRLEGIWHSGSPLGMMISALQGMIICVPRNMLQAVGMYNALLKAKEPAVVVETLNAYRLRERAPSNLETYTVAIGRVEIMRAGTAVTVVTYGACVLICEEAAATLAEEGIDVELIDVQTLLPLDVEGAIGASLAKTGRLLVVDEDIPGGANAYILRHVLEEQQGYHLLDAKPRTLTAKAHRPPFGSDGDYFTKPNAEDVIEAIVDMVAE